PGGPYKQDSLHSLELSDSCGLVFHALHRAGVLGNELANTNIPEVKVRRIVEKAGQVPSNGIPILPLRESTPVIALRQIGEHTQLPADGLKGDRGLFFLSSLQAAHRNVAASGFLGSK